MEVRLENVTYTYDGKRNAVEDIDLDFEDKTANALLGPSGCGKTTLLKIISGLLKPTEGRVYFDGKDVTDVNARERNVAMVFQFPVVYSGTVLDNLTFPLLNRGMTKVQMSRKTSEIANILGLNLDQTAEKLGPAERQTVAVGRALVRAPNVFIYDEPVSAIEPEKRSDIKTEIVRIQKELAQTMIYVTHDQAEAITFAEKIAVMNNGRVIQFGSVKELYDRPAHLFVGQFLGSPGLNVLDCTLNNNRFDFQDFHLDVPKELKDPGKYGGAFKVGIRPEYVQVTRGHEEGAIRFRCTYTEFLGNNLWILHLSSEHNILRAKGNFPEISEGDVWVRLPDRNMLIFDEAGRLIQT